MAKKIESAKIIIKGEEITFLKPRALDVIRIEDKCFNIDGGVDVYGYNEAMLGLATRKYKVEDLVDFASAPIKLSSGEEVLLPEISYKDWFKKVVGMVSFSRIETAEEAIKLITGDKNANVEDMAYSDIEALSGAYYGAYNQEELTRVVEEVATFCK